MCDITKTSETVVSLFIKFVTAIGYWKSFLAILFLLTICMIVYICGKYLDEIIHMKENKEKKEIEKNKIKNQNDLIDIAKKTLNESLGHSVLITKIIDKLHNSIEKENYEILTDYFIGTNRSFLVNIKSKIFTYLEAEEKTNFIYIKNEIINLFCQIVNDNIKKFIFEDKNENSRKLKEKSKILIINFLNKIQNYTENDNIGKVECFIESENGLYLLGKELKLLLLEYYKDMIDLRQDISYCLKGNN